MSCDAEANDYIATDGEQSEQKADSEEVLFELLKLLGVII